jgi:hypothetical protein
MAQIVVHLLIIKTVGGTAHGNNVQFASVFFIFIEISDLNMRCISSQNHRLNVRQTVQKTLFHATVYPEYKGRKVGRRATVGQKKHIFSSLLLRKIDCIADNQVKY